MQILTMLSYLMRVRAKERERERKRSGEYISSPETTSNKSVYLFFFYLGYTFCAPLNPLQFLFLLPFL